MQKVLVRPGGAYLLKGEMYDTRDCMRVGGEKARKTTEGD